MTTSMSSFSNAFLRSGPRVCEFGAWPQKNTAFSVSDCATFSLASSTPSAQRESGMPASSISFLSLKRASIQS